MLWHFTDDLMARSLDEPVFSAVACRQSGGPVAWHQGCDRDGDDGAEDLRPIFRFDTHFDSRVPFALLDLIQQNGNCALNAQRQRGLRQIVLGALIEGMKP